MNYKKFCMILSFIISVFLFISGSFILHYLNTLNVSAQGIDDNNENVNDLLKPFVQDNKTNVLVMVGDKEEANTDTMMLASLDTKTNVLNIMSIPRDTRVENSGLKIPKVNSLYVQKDGHKLVVDTLSTMLGTEIDYYVYFNIDVFRQIINELDGVYIDVPVDMDYDDPLQDLHIHLKKGYQLLDGEKAEQYLRFRHPNGSEYSEEMLKYYNGSDIDRISAQQNFLKELIRQKANIKYISRIDDIMNLVFDNIKTDITLNEVLKIMKSASDFNTENLHTYTLPGEAAQIDEIWYFIYDRTQGQPILDENF